MVGGVLVTGSVAGKGVAAGAANGVAALAGVTVDATFAVALPAIAALGAALAVVTEFGRAASFPCRAFGTEADCTEVVRVVGRALLRSAAVADSSSENLLRKELAAAGCLFADFVSCANGDPLVPSELSKLIKRVEPPHNFKHSTLHYQPYVKIDCHAPSPSTPRPRSHGRATRSLCS